MADKSTPLIVEALTRAYARPEGMPLFGNKKTPGLFATSASSKAIAQKCKDDGLLRVIKREQSGKSVQEICAITEQGATFLLDQTSPRPILEELVRTLQTRRGQLQDLMTTARQWQEGSQELVNHVEKVLEQVQSTRISTTSSRQSNGVDHSDWLPDTLEFLDSWTLSSPTGDCPLPRLFHHLQQAHPELTIGMFHDGLRRLHANQQAYLHPWTGPRHEIPEPQFALLIGHDIAYYISRR